METKKRLMDAYLNGEVPKIKTHFAEIIVRGQTEKPYYNIIFIDPQTREYEVCFGSYSLENVRKWLSEEFEIVEAPIVDAVEVVHAEWLDIRFDPMWKSMLATCSHCKIRGEVRVKANECGFAVPDSEYCPNCGAKMDGGSD